MIPLKQSTASQEVILGPFLDSTDGNTAETGLTIANTDIKIWKQGATAYVSKNSGGATLITDDTFGLYQCTLDATDTDTLGALVINVHVSGSLAVKVNCLVYPAAVFDALYGAGNLTVELAADAITAAKIADNAFSAEHFADECFSEANYPAGYFKI